MLLNIFQQFNWVDIFVVIVLFRIGYVSIKNGFPKEIFKLFGTVAAIYFSLHYYTVISDFIQERISLEKLLLEFLDFLVFLVLAILGYLVFVLFRSVFCRFIKMEAVSYLNKWGGLVIGIIRGFFLAGLITFILVISSVGYLKKSAGHSYFSKFLFNVSPNTYTWLWNSITSKFMTSEKFNKTILEVKEDFVQK